MRRAVAMAKKPRKRLEYLSVAGRSSDVGNTYMLMNKAQVSVSTAARHTGHFRFHLAMSFPDRRKPNLSNRLVGECTAGMISWANLESADSGCLKKLATASPIVAGKCQTICLTVGNDESIPNGRKLRESARLIKLPASTIKQTIRPTKTRVLTPTPHSCSNL